MTTTSTATTSTKVHYNTTIYNTTAPAPTVVPTTSLTSLVVPTTTIVDTTVVVESCSVPTPVVSTCKVPGTYTFPATTVIVTETTTVCGASTTKVPAGTHTLGGVTTVVATETTFVCPFATTSTQSNGVVTSIIKETTYVCPSAGTYTIAPITTVVTKESVVAVPIVTSYVPGTYTRPAVVTTVTETDVVIVCPFSVPTTSTVVPVVTPTTTVVPVVTPTTSVVPVVTAPVEVSTTVVPATTKTESKTSASASATTTPSKLGGGDQWAITYTPYSSGGGCKAASDVLSDLKEIQSKGFNTIRVYSTDCDTLPNVGAACEEIGLKMIIGVFIGEVGCDNASPDVASQISAIKAWAKWDLVELVVVGNEAGFQKFCTPSELSGLITEVKEIIKTDGYTVPVTTTDTVATWEDSEFSTALCAVVDVVACNAHAYFNAETTPSNAGKFVAGQLDIVKNICGKDGYVLETGWPSSCVANGVATCSEDDQATAISSLKAELGGSVVFFSYSNDDWKDNGSCECEQHWGCGQLFA